ncbi:hypothetical protein LIER_31610 [Lithospermum erythrorhizon]|uniref:DUF4283 domain-containing protein n=1 Tax=Lithospermum erythrorhizon TaxID=34254 RepID=A0AAV3RVH0_LITER
MDRQWVLDCQGVCSEGAYMVYGKMLSLRVLPDGFSPDDAAFLKVPLWVKFPYLPQRDWTKSGFGKISSIIGNPICPDQITWDRSRTSYARLLVVVDISQEPVTSFNVNLPEGEKIGQKVEFELFPEFCCHCKAYGHNFFGCELLGPPMVDVGLEPTVAPEDDQDAREDVCEDLDPVGDSEDEISHEAEDSKEELELDDKVGVSEEELERDEFIEV